MDDLADTRAPTGFDLLTELGRDDWFVYVVSAGDDERVKLGATRLGRRIEVFGTSVDDVAPELYREAMAA